MAAAIIALPNTVTNDVVVATSDAELRISDRGLGLGLEVVGGGAAEVKLEARPGWRFRDGSTSVTLNKAAGKSVKSPNAVGEGQSAEGSATIVIEDGEDDDDEHGKGSVEHEKPVLSLTASAPKVVAYSVLDGGTNVSIALSATVTTKGRHRELDEDGNVVKEEEFSPKRYVWKMTGAATGEAETDSSTHTFVASLTKGKDKKLNFSVVGKICGICDGEVESDKATDSVEIDVYELSISRPDYLGLDRTDAGRQGRVVKTATLSSDPSLPSSSSVEWTECGICEFVGEKNKLTVSYQNKDSDTASGEYLAERLAASVTLAGMDSSVVCATNFTVVKVDVTIVGVGEDNEESKGAMLRHVPDENGAISLNGRSNMVSVAISCHPNSLSANEIISVTCHGQGELYEVLSDGRLSKIASEKFPWNEFSGYNFMLHGHKVSYSDVDGGISVVHMSSAASDVAKYASFGIEVIVAEMAPADTSLYRTRLGVGERVFVRSFPNAEAISCERGVITPFGGVGAKYDAPYRACGDKITAKFSSVGKCEVALSVLEPTGFKVVGSMADRYRIGVAAAGMTVKLQMLPLSVSFGRLELKEIGKAATDATGYFSRSDLAQYLVHVPLDWKAIEKDNIIGDDHAYVEELPRPWDNGSFSWEVPARWRVMDNGDSEKEFPWSNQQFSITSEGTVRVSKFGLQVERAISQNFGTIQ